MNAVPTPTAIPGYAPGTWRADPAHCEVAFSVRQLVISKARGRFTGHDVTIVTAEDPLESSVTAVIDVASLSTGNAKRDKHLLSADYFDAGQFPEITYASTGIREAGDGWIVDGDLTLHGVTEHVPLVLSVTEFDGRRARFTASTSISRRVFGVGAGAPKAAAVVVDDAVTVTLRIDATRAH